MLPPILKPYSEAQYDRRESVCGVLMLSAIAWLVVMYFTTWRIGVLTAVAAVFAGAAFGCYMNRRTERGVWMLALFVGVCVVAFYVLALVMNLRDVLAGRGPVGRLALDIAGATALVTVTARASWTVVVQNRKLSV